MFLGGHPKFCILQARPLCAGLWHGTAVSLAGCGGLREPACSIQMECTPTTIMLGTRDLLEVPVDVSKSRMALVKQS